MSETTRGVQGGQNTTNNLVVPNRYSFQNNTAVQVAPNRYSNVRKVVFSLCTGLAPTTLGTVTTDLVIDVQDGHRFYLSGFTVA